MKVAIVIDKSSSCATTSLQHIELDQELVLVITKHSRSLDSQLELDLVVLLHTQLLLLLMLLLALLKKIARVENTLSK